jgi:hypothetical protein
MSFHGMPRRSLEAAPQPKSPINWRRGLFRVWLLISAAWIMSWVIYLLMDGIQGGFRTTGDFLVVPVLLFGPPVALWLTGLAAGWAFRGFIVDDVVQDNK